MTALDLGIAAGLLDVFLILGCYLAIRSGL